MTFKEVQRLIDENEYLNDTNEELEESLLINNEELQIFAKMYNDYTKKIAADYITLENYKDELKEIKRKEESLGKLSKKQIERKEFLQKEIDNMLAECEISKENKKEAQKSYHELADKKTNSIVQRKIKANEKKIKENEEQLVKVYKDIKRKINKLDKEIKEKSTRMFELYSSGEEEYLQLNAEIYLANKEKQELINENDKILKLIEKTGLVKVEDKKLESEKKVVKNHDHTKEENIEDNKKQVEAEDDEFEELEEIEEDENLENHEEPEMFEDLDDDESLEETKTNTTIPLYNESDGPIFVDESRIDKNHSWMTAVNAANLGYLNNKDFKDIKEESKQEELEEEILENIPIPEDTILEEVEMNGPVIDNYPEEIKEQVEDQNKEESIGQIIENSVQNNVMEEPKIEKLAEPSQDNREIDVEKIQEKLNNQAYASPTPAEIDVEKIREGLKNNAPVAEPVEPILNYDNLDNYNVEYVQLPEKYMDKEDQKTEIEIMKEDLAELKSLQAAGHVVKDDKNIADMISEIENKLGENNLTDEYNPASNFTTVAIDAAQLFAGKIKSMMKASKELSKKILSSAKTKKIEPLYYENLVKYNEEEMQRGSR